MFAVKHRYWPILIVILLLGIFLWLFQLFYSADKTESGQTEFIPKVSRHEAKSSPRNQNPTTGKIAYSQNNDSHPENSDLSINKLEQFIPIPVQKEGIVSANYPDGQKRIEGTYHKGRPQGHWRFWYLNGKLAMETYWRNGVPEGKATHWYENGQKKGEVYFLKGKAEGRWRRWYQNGQLWQDMSIHAGEVKTLTVWDEQGRLMADMAIQQHKQNGVVLTWYASGTKKSELIFKQDQLIHKTEWDEDGNVIESGDGN